ncbi:MAG: mevalonate kinase, partial [candidate division Zixibacteria bacterium]|nr:mevalonate kinase [candidate division Zixibacteria bacterium]NIS48094.1 mevalonate kinase [candidate division Zixibacteria bacterium]NIU16215.1 mevalonate kinase [candidate division Zixibacteria bacterium]NIV08355.1 mevalonate kinase [candidate division Zixibacteria bacterium]
MPAFSASAPGKIILFGEHAVVYGQPGIAVPVTQVQAKAIVQADIDAPPGRIRIQAPEIGFDSNLDELSPLHPFRAAIDLLFKHFGIESSPAFRLQIKSTIPIAAGLGSGAAVTVAILRGISAFLGHPLAD